MGVNGSILDNLAGARGGRLVSKEFSEASWSFCRVPCGYRSRTCWVPSEPFFSSTFAPALDVEEKASAVRRAETI